MTFENNFQVEQRLGGLFMSNKNHFVHSACVLNQTQLLT